MDGEASAVSACCYPPPVAARTLSLGFGSWVTRNDIRAGPPAPAMDEGCSRIRRRVSVRKRNRRSLESVFAALTAAELKPGDEEKEDEDEETVAGSRRRKTMDVQPVEVQPRHLSNSPEFHVPFPTCGLMLQIQVSHCACSLKEARETPLKKAWLERQEVWQFPSRVQTIDQLSTSLRGLTSSLLSLLILTCEVLHC